MSRSLSYETSLAVPPRQASRIRNRCVARTTRGTDVPGWARRPLRPRDTVTQHELWHDPWADGTRVYDIVATLANVPVGIRGQGSVTPAGRHARRHHLERV